MVHDGAGPLEKLQQGLRFARQTLPIRALLLLLGLVSFMALPFTVLMPIFADKIFGGGASAYGTLMGAVGVGAMFGALAIAMRQQLRGLGNVVAICADGPGRLADSVQRVALVLAVAGRPGAHRIHDDDAVHGHQHADPGDGARPAARARDVAVRDDVSGDDAHRFAIRRSDCGTYRRADYGGHWRRGERGRGARFFTGNGPPCALRRANWWPRRG